MKHPAHGRCFSNIVFLSLLIAMSLIGQGQRGESWRQRADLGKMARVSPSESESPTKATPAPRKKHPGKNLSKAPADELSDLERAASPSSISVTHLSLETVIVTMPQWVTRSTKMRVHTAFSRGIAASPVPHGLAIIQSLL